MDSGERGMNPVTMTINPRKKYRPSWGSNQRPLVLKSATPPTELRDLASNTDPDLPNVVMELSSLLYDVKRRFQHYFSYVVAVTT